MDPIIPTDKKLFLTSEQLDYLKEYLTIELNALPQTTESRLTYHYKMLEKIIQNLNPRG